MPADTYNGLASTVLTNLAAGAQQATIAIVIGGDKPRLAHLKSTLSGQKDFTLGGVKREAAEWIVHVDLGGVAKVVAPIIGKQPPDYHVLIAGGEDPVFIREEGPLYEGGPDMACSTDQRGTARVINLTRRAMLLRKVFSDSGIPFKTSLE